MKKLSLVLLGLTFLLILLMWLTSGHLTLSQQDVLTNLLFALIVANQFSLMYWALFAHK